jgi:hypothetical protein
MGEGASFQFRKAGPILRKGRAKRIAREFRVMKEKRVGTGLYRALAEFLHAAFLFLALLLCHISYRQVQRIVRMLHNTSPVADLFKR